MRLLRERSVFFFMFLFFGLMSCGHARFPESDHYRDGRFENIGEVGGGKSFWKVLKWQLGSSRKKWPELVEDNVTPEFAAKVSPGVVHVTFINHATEVLQFDGVTVLTDPVFSERVSPFSWLGPKRHRKAGAEIHQLPKVDAVVISHNHYDHMDLTSLKKIDERDHPKFIVPLGNKKILNGEGIKDVVELDWWASVKLEHGTVTLVPMQHWSRRGLGDRNHALWGGYVIEASGLKVLFAGDTGYGPQFKMIAEKFGAMDVSLLPIGAYEPRWFMSAQHMNPAESVKAHLELKSKYSVGMHFGTFQLTDEGIEDPVTDLRASLTEAKVEESRFVAPKNGQTLRWPRTDR